MDIIASLTVVISLFAVLASLGVLLTRDNFYAALYMSITMVFVAAIYAILDIQPAVVLITLIFIGAVGIVTIALAATYRAVPTRKINLAWGLPLIIVFGLVCYVYMNTTGGKIEVIGSNNLIAVPYEYFFVLLLLFSVIILMMLSAIKFVRGSRL